MGEGRIGRGVGEHILYTCFIIRLVFFYNVCEYWTEMLYDTKGDRT